MRHFISSLAIIVSCALNGALSLGGAMQGLEDAMEIQREQLERLHDFLGPMTQPSSATKRQESTITFSNPAAEKFFVDGTKIPLGLYSTHHVSTPKLTRLASSVNFDAGPSWSGLMPISGVSPRLYITDMAEMAIQDPKETRKLFFWYL